MMGVVGGGTPVMVGVVVWGSGPLAALLPSP